MSNRFFTLSLCGLVSCVLSATTLRSALGQDPLSDEEKATLLAEHIFGGMPAGGEDEGPLLVRRGYVTRYDTDGRVPVWVAYHVTPEYRDTPTRQGQFKTFRTDPDLPNPVEDDDYDGLFDARGFARGHLAPYAVMGGDRDNDNKNAAAGDDFDVRTVHEANYMSNIAPQHHNGFNGSGGIWFELERWVQDDVVKNGGHEVWIFAGCIFGPGEHEVVGPDDDIWVPAMFYKIVIRGSGHPGRPKVLAFLFPHHRAAHGDIEDFLVPVDVIEAMTGLDFFTGLDDEDEYWLEEEDTWESWSGFLSGSASQPGSRRRRDE